MSNDQNNGIFHLALPKGRIATGVDRLLADAGIDVRDSARSYRPWISVEGIEVKRLKPQAIIEMLDVGRRDLGFGGADWVAELDASVVEVLDTRLDPVRIVAAAPRSLLVDGCLPERPLVIATEYVEITRQWVEREGLDATVLRSWGATEVLPPEDCDLIVDNTATGSTLEANDLEILATLMTSSTRMFASRQAMADPVKRQRIDDLTLVLGSVLEARGRVIVEVNVDAEALDAVLAVLPAMRRPTVSELAGGGYAVKAAVARRRLPTLIPELKVAGGLDLIVTEPSQIVA